MRYRIILVLTIITIVWQTFGACLHKAGNYYKVYSHNKVSNSTVDAAVITSYLYPGNKSKISISYENDNKSGMSNKKIEHQPSNNTEVQQNNVENNNEVVIDEDDDISVFDIEKRRIVQNRHLNTHQMKYDIPLIYNIDKRYDIEIRNCKKAKNHIQLHPDEMADIWETVYYDLPHKVKCFRMHIRKLNTWDKKKYAEFYGTFNGKIKWDLCNLEIESSKLMRRHFLQGKGTDGVLENIIFDENGKSLPNYHVESPDQWMVMKNLLLMRDCKTGHVVVFTRVPYIPIRNDVIAALRYFGEDVVIGKIACDENEIVAEKLNRQVQDIVRDDNFDDILLNNYSIYTK